MDHPLLGGTAKIDCWRLILAVGDRLREKKGRRRRRGKEERRRGEEGRRPPFPVPFSVVRRRRPWVARVSSPTGDSSPARGDG
ncbi:hypothetical protein BHE74_00055581, partial [Ensete ventricosum]